MRSELSKKNPFWLSKERYLELKHYAKSYWDNKCELKYLPEEKIHSEFVTSTNKRIYFNSSRTEKTVLRCIQLETKVETIEKAASVVGGDVFAPYILWCATEGMSYDAINAQCPIPCGRRQFYQMYRQFFWILDQLLMGNADTQKA